MISDIEIEPKANDLRLVNIDRETCLIDLFPLDEFVVKFALDGSEVNFEVGLSEWLIALTDFLNSAARDAVQSVDELLTISGDRFRATYRGGVFTFHLFDCKQLSTVDVALGRGDVFKLHQHMKDALLFNVRKAAGRDVLIRDIGKISLECGV